MTAMAITRLRLRRDADVHRMAGERLLRRLGGTYVRAMRAVGTSRVGVVGVRLSSPGSAVGGSMSLRGSVRRPQAAMAPGRVA